MYKGELEGISEPQKRHIQGLGLIIINPNNGKIWTIIEQKDKPKTLRIKGQRSIPLETMKTNETLLDNLEGAMAEAFDDVDANGKDIRKYLIAHLFCIGDPRNNIHHGFSLEIDGNVIDCNYAVLFYDGEDLPLRPYNYNEVDDGRWTAPFVLLCQGSRKLAQLAISQFFFSGRYSELLETYQQNPHLRRQIFNDDFSIREVFLRRELKVDN